MTPSTWAVVMALLATWHAMARADAGAACRSLRAQRDALTSAAMEQELSLARTIRGRLCPDLASRAEGANARDGIYTSIDYAAWSHCRQQAERQLAASHRVHYRNSRRFTFYTAEGARLARQADALLMSQRGERCP
ncbi:MAG: hypothetical protein VKO39_04620 [Cyanobacteriota bacterium]|nr:hypothetical protein [Cyanobacteriota bacterium]